MTADAAGAGVPDGMGFLKLLQEMEDRCESRSLEALKDAGDNLPALVSDLGTVLKAADMAASCLHGCSKGHHAVEYLLTSVESYARAAIRLSLLGFYDESLTISRSVGEKANLFMLFVHEPTKLREWVASSEDERRRKFSAVKVRLALEQHSHAIPVDQTRYRALSGRGIHPGGTPQDHNPERHPGTGGYFQEAGMFITLNEIGRQLAYAYGLGVLLLDHLPTHRRVELQQSAVRLAEKIGRLDLTTIEDLWRDLTSTKAAQNPIGE